MHGPYNFAFSPGATTTLVSVNITDDDVIENTETFTLTIDQSSLPNGIIRRYYTAIIVEIYNDDCELASHVVHRL